jgi:RNA polymerase sigma factor (sigma-70 family)
MSQNPGDRHLVVTVDCAKEPAMTGTDRATEAFVAHRNLLFTVAYELLGSAADAEDVLQETWLRWVGVDLDTVQDQRAYLVRIASRQALMRLRTLGRRRESYVGPWLPEPLLTAPDVAEDVELADSVSMAMLLVLETLKPTERAVFVLTSRRVGPAGSSPPMRPGTRSRRSSAPSTPGTCKAWSTSSRRTSSSSATAVASSRRCPGRLWALTRSPDCCRSGCAGWVRRRWS